MSIPCTVKLAEASDGLLLATVQVLSPGSLSVTVRVWVYCADTGSSNTVSVPSVTGTESLVQVTVVAGPPVEIWVRVNRGFGPSRSEITTNRISEDII